MSEAVELVALGGSYAVAAVVLALPAAIRRASWWCRPALVLVVATADVLQLFVTAPVRHPGGRRRRSAIS